MEPADTLTEHIHCCVVKMCQVQMSSLPAVTTRSEIHENGNISSHHPQRPLDNAATLDSQGSDVLPTNPNLHNEASQLNHALENGQRRHFSLVQFLSIALAMLNVLVKLQTEKAIAECCPTENSTPLPRCCCLYQPFSSSSIFRGTRFIHISTSIHMITANLVFV